MLYPPCTMLTVLVPDQDAAMKRPRGTSRSGTEYICLPVRPTFL